MKRWQLLAPCSDSFGLSNPDYGAYGCTLNVWHLLILY